jgi:RHS repeat-associated protein
MRTYEKNLTTGVIREYAYLNNQIIGWQETDNTGNSVKRYAATDLLGSVTTVTDESGRVLWSGEYTAFGNVAYGSGDVLYDGMYTGKDIDSETGLTYHWNRWRSEDGSSFISEDPARDGSNWYGYCGNNPINSTDPTGLAPYVNGVYDGDYDPDYQPPMGPQPENKPEEPKQGPTESQKVEVPLPKVVDFIFNFFKRNAEFLTHADVFKDKILHDILATVKVFYVPIELKYDPRVTSDYGMRKNPLTGNSKIHTGRDIATNDPVPVLAGLDGTIVEIAKNDRIYGNAVVIRTEKDGLEILCLSAHLASVAVKVGDKVYAGFSTIGIEGSTGMSTGIHVHQEFQVNGVSVTHEAFDYVNGSKY